MYYSPAIRDGLTARWDKWLRVTPVSHGRYLIRGFPRNMPPKILKTEEKKVPPKPLGDSRVTFRSDRRGGPPRIQHLSAIPAFPFPLFIRGALPDVRVVRGRARSTGPFWGRCRGPVDVRLVSARSTKRKDGCPKGALCRKKRAVPSEGSLKKEPALAKFGAALYAR
ncbi:hypothetical protein MRX96_026881 [Rhipicephalus microplus]